MFSYIVYCLSIFLIVLEVIVLFFLLQSIIYMGQRVKKFSFMLIAPMLFPMQRLVQKSVMNTFSVDLSPYLILIVLFYLEKFCGYLLSV